MLLPWSFQMRLLSVLVLALSFSFFTVGAEDTIQMFNGKDLTGWEGNPKLWSVEDGAITGKTGTEPHNKLKHNTFLVWKGGEVSDFEFTCKYKIVGGNSGVQYRSKKIGDGEFGPRIGGYQADFEAGKTYSGILYDEGGVAGGRGIMCARGEMVKWNADNKKEVVGKTPKSSQELQDSIKNNEWNEYKIVAKGNHLTHMINGNVTADVVDESPKAVKSGVLALQIHVGPVMTVQFKDLNLKKLSAGSDSEKKKQ
jgi:hypothetical protein